ncbi:unnamed protein product, partial [marine sediment metagenome]
QITCDKFGIACKYNNSTETIEPESVNDEIYWQENIEKERDRAGSG